jgi:hypothetical protein
MFWRQVYFTSMVLFLLSKALLAADPRAILELTINEIKKGEVVVFLREPDVLVRVKDLEAAGIKSFAGRREHILGDDYVLLNSLAPQVTFKLDDRDLTLSLTVQPSLLGYNLLEMQPNKPPDIVYSEDTSGFFNYSVSLRDFKRTDAFGELGVTIKNTLLYNGILRNGDGSIVRGLSNLTISDRQSLNRTVVGDRLVSSDLLGEPWQWGASVFFVILVSIPISCNIQVSTSRDQSPPLPRWTSMSMASSCVASHCRQVNSNSKIYRFRPAPTTPGWY